MTYNVEKIAKYGLCKGCCACMQICPAECIRLYEDKLRGIFSVLVNSDLCTNCRKCLEVCPASNLKLTHKEMIGGHSDPMFGYVAHIWTGYSYDPDIRFKGASGGVITAILVYLIESKLATCALVISSLPGNPFYPSPLLVRNKEDIIEAAGSKYMPIPLNSAIEKLRHLGKNDIVIIVGLPCHITGLRRVISNDKKLKEKVYLYLGLFCGQTPCFNATRYSLKVRGIKEKDVLEIRYRGEGWPGKMCVSLKDGREISISYKDKYAMGCVLSSLFFTPPHCLFCNDSSSEMADISFADAWLDEFKEDKLGRSLIVARNVKGKEIIESLVSERILVAESVSIEKALTMQRGILIESKISSKIRRKLLSTVSRLEFMEEDLHLAKTAILKAKAVMIFPIMRLIFRLKLASIAERFPFWLIYLSKILGKLR